MASKKSGKNGFMKFCMLQQQNNDSLSGLSTAELVAKCSPFWEKLSVEERNHFRRYIEFKSLRPQPNIKCVSLSEGQLPRGSRGATKDLKFDSYGR